MNDPQDKNDAFQSAIRQIAEEKNISEKKVIETIEAALAAAYRKDFGEKDQNIEVEFETKTGQSRVYDVKEVVKKEEDIEDPAVQITLKEAKEINKDAKVGDKLKTELEPPEAYGRIAAQTAKQVIIQRIREAERESILEEYSDKEGEVINAVVQRVEGRDVFLDIGHATGLMPYDEQVQAEHYTVGQRLKVLLKEVRKTPRGPEIILSRSDPKMVKKLFELEVPEIAADTVKIKAIAREAGDRTKIAVISEDETIDPVGSAVGQRGTRVQTVIAELSGEKIDIIEWSEDPSEFIANALSPARVLRVETSDEDRTARVFVDEDQLSLAIGKNGQNVRLAAKLTGWRIDVVKEGEEEEKKEKDKEEKAEETDEPKKEDKKKEKEKKAKPKDEEEEKPKKEKKLKKKKKSKKAKETKKSEDKKEEPENKDAKEDESKKKEPKKES